jgi:hypothetical protein
LTMGRTAPTLDRHLAAKGPDRQVGQPGAELTAPNQAARRLLPRRPRAHEDVQSGYGGPWLHMLLAARQESAIAFW